MQCHFISKLIALKYVDSQTYYISLNVTEITSSYKSISSYNQTNQYHHIIKQTTLSEYSSNTYLHIYLNNCISLNKLIHHHIKELSIILSELNTHSSFLFQKALAANCSLQYILVQIIVN